MQRVEVLLLLPAAFELLPSQSMRDCLPRFVQPIPISGPDLGLSLFEIHEQKERLREMAATVEVCKSLVPRSAVLVRCLVSASLVVTIAAMGILLMKMCIVLYISYNLCELRFL